MLLYSADSNRQISYFSKNGSERTSLCAPKVIQKVNFPKYFPAIVHGRDCRFAPILQFFSAASQHTAKFPTVRFRQFRSMLKKDSITNYYKWIWTQFLLEDYMFVTTH